MDERKVAPPGTDDLPETISRRDLIMRGGSLAALAWAAPAITRMPGSYARGTDGLCEPDSSGVRDFSTPGPLSFEVPLGVTSITVEVWGAGGNGAAGAFGTGGKGGGGGGYARRTYTDVTPCSVYSGTVGAGGGGMATSFLGPQALEVSANAGANGTGQTTGGAGGTANGETAITGGDGGNGSTGSGNSDGAGGGGGASPPDGEVETRNGGAAAPRDGGDGGSGTGNGGDGGDRDEVGSPGAAPGGGGGGGGRDLGGGDGADGLVRITWNT